MRVEHFIDHAVIEAAMLDPLECFIRGLAHYPGLVFRHGAEDAGVQTFPVGESGTGALLRHRRLSPEADWPIPVRRSQPSRQFDQLLFVDFQVDVPLLQRHRGKG